ncbi:MAG: alpha-amylase family glycosyl hydrolase, partial [Desulfobacterales bacterium]|nr:alpha-amylase family glycosyl hydrolase [Desulfobacterales bacterium]
MAPNPPPLIATYRVQFTPAFGFAQATELISYLKDLGVSHVYASPYLMATAGSAHGYNVVDPGRVNPELGGESGHRRFCEALSRAGIGQILDIVPNHMAIGGRQNRFWWDVLRNGPGGRWASFFDIGWESADPKLHHKVLLPILGAPYGRCLSDGQITLQREGDELTVRYYAHEMPVAAETEDTLLDTALRTINGDRPLRPDPKSGAGRSGIHAAPAAGPPPEKARGRDLRAALTANPALAGALDQVLAETNADPEQVDRLLQQQHYRLAFWRTAARDINYRRFFDIDQLAGIRVETEAVFTETHRLVLDWVRQGVIDGLRIDHPDGLRDPAGYLRRLRDAAPAAWIGVEKILEPEEHLPTGWPVAGTTGYDFLNQVGGLFVDPAGEPAFTRLYRSITGQSADFPALVRHKKHL